MYIKRYNLCITKFKFLENKKYLLFTPKSLNIITPDINRLKFLQSYNNLPIDLKNENGIPTRLRRYANYNVDINNNYFDIQYTGKDTFKQNVPDSRRVKRTFELIENEYIYDKFIIDLIERCTTLTIFNSEKIPKSLNISLHQVRQICYPYIESHNSPEGIHQDGVDFIVSALVLNKKNITGGKSFIYNKNKRILHIKNLNQDEGIFQDDKDLWHYVTPISSINNYIGYRDILGIDISIIS